MNEIEKEQNNSDTALLDLLAAIIVPSRKRCIKFSTEEDNFLRNKLENYTGKIDWKEITQRMAQYTNRPQRNIQTVEQHWNRVLKYEFEMVFFTEEEDKEIMQMYQEQKTCAFIARQINNYSDLQIRERIKYLLQQQ